MKNRFLSFQEGEDFDLPSLRLDDLQLDNLMLYQDKTSYCFTSDSVLLANFVNAKKSHTVVDLCSGSGIVGILVGHKTKCKEVILVELQEKLALLSSKSVILNQKQDQVKVLNTSVQQVLSFLTEGKADIVVCNPPYKKMAASFTSKNPEIALARQEVAVTLKEIIDVSSKLLNTGGKMYLCNDASRTAEMLSLLKSKKLEPKRMFFTYPGQNKEASIVFVEAVKGGKEGVIVLPPVIANDQDGTYLPTIQKLFQGENE